MIKVHCVKDKVQACTEEHEISKQTLGGVVEYIVMSKVWTRIRLIVWWTVDWKVKSIVKNK